MRSSSRAGIILGVICVLLFFERSVCFGGSDYLSVKDLPYGARGDGLTDDATAIQQAITDAIAQNRGTVFFPPGVYVCASPVVVPPGSQGLTLLGVGGATSGLGLSSLLKFTGSGGGSFLIAGRTSGTTLRSLAIGYSSSAFSGTLLNFDSAEPFEDTSFVVIENCFVGGLGGVTGARTLIAFTHSSRIGIYRSNITGAIVGIRGTASASDYANIVRIVDCRFGNLSTAIKNAGQDWVISGNGFVATPGGVAAGYDQDPGVCANGVNFFGNWMGDVAGGGTWIRFCGNNVTLVGNHIFGDRTSTGVQIVGSSSFGICIHGNDIGYHRVGIDLGSNQAGISIQGNNFAPMVATPIQGLSGHTETLIAGNNPAGTSLIDTSGSIRSEGSVEAASVWARGPIQARSVTSSGAVQGTLLVAAVPQVGAIMGNGTSNDLLHQIRPNAGKNGWLTFTEDTVEDRWSLGIRGGDANLYLSSGNPGAGRPRVVFNDIGVGIGGVAPSAALDTPGAVATRVASLAVSAARNPDVPARNKGFLRLTGAPGPFSIGGFEGGVNGQLLVVYNATGQPMTLSNEDPRSQPANRLKTLVESDVTLRAGPSAATFMYDPADSRWILLGTN